MIRVANVISVGVVIASAVAPSNTSTRASQMLPVIPRKASETDPTTRHGTIVQTAPNRRAMAGARTVAGTVTIWATKKMTPIKEVDVPKSC